MPQGAIFLAAFLLEHWSCPSVLNLARSMPLGATLLGVVFHFLPTAALAGHEQGLASTKSSPGPPSWGKAKGGQLGENVIGLAGPHRKRARQAL
jgi:hypothetical protein